MRCFTFQDFQITPTLEEYEHFLRLPLTKTPPYFYRDITPRGVLESEMIRRKLNRNGMEGLPQMYLEERLRYFLEEDEWSTFLDILGLLVYGNILFPHINDYMDIAIIDAFLTSRDQGENPNIAILANTYCTLNNCYERKGKSMVGYKHLLYLWLIAHMFHSKCKSVCPMEDFKWCLMKAMTNKEWAQHLRHATERTVCWYPKWNEWKDIIYKCGGFPNVPLMGTQGCTNYNPTLVLRQFGYPMILPLIEEAITLFMVYGLGAQNGELFRRIMQAWRNVLKKGCK
ncbi:hypothetical protein CR513_12249, partial [Mucuna pruriens]